MKKKPSEPFETFEEFMERKRQLQVTCRHDWRTVYNQWTDEPTGRRCEHCWKQDSVVEARP